MFMTGVLCTIYGAQLYFYFLNVHYLLVCENFRRIAVTISFLLGPRHGKYAGASFSANMTSWCSCNNKQIFTSVILHMNIIFIAKWLFGGNSESIHFSDVFECLQKLFKPENIFKQTRINFSFLNYVTATLRALFAWRGSNDKNKKHAKIKSTQKYPDLWYRFQGQKGQILRSWGIGKWFPDQNWLCIPPMIKHHTFINELKNFCLSIAPAQ